MLCQLEAGVQCSARKKEVFKMQRYFVLTVVSILFGIAIFASGSSAKEWIIFDEELPQDTSTTGAIEVSKEKQFEGDACLKYTGNGLAWSGIVDLDFDLTGITYDDAFLEFYAVPAEAGVTLEIRILGLNGLPDMESRVHPQLTVTEYEQIKIPLRHFVNRATAKIPKTLDDFTGGNNIVTQLMIAGTAGPVYIDNVRIADTEEGEEQHSVLSLGKLATSWARLKSENCH